LLVLLVVVAAYRLTLLGRGATAFVDETLYFASVIALQALAGGHLRAAAEAVTIARGRQVAAILQLPVAALQAAPSAFGVPASNLRSLLIPTAVNVVVSLAIVWLFFRISVVLSRNPWASVTATAAYALLVNTNLYIRHLLPYDWSLLVGVVAVWLMVTRRATARLAFTIGVAGGVIVGLYSGYYLLAAVIGVAFVIRLVPRGWWPVCQGSAAVAAGVAIVVVALEVVCRAGGVSYIESSRILGRSINLGSFDEGWTFLPAYLWGVEGVSGALLLVATVVGLVRAGARVWRGVATDIDWLLLSALLGWMAQAALSANARAIVLYGRLIHPWMFFMALALGDAVATIRRETIRRVVCGLVWLAAVGSWSMPARAYYRLAYPPDVLYSLRIDTTRLPPDRMVCELTPGTSYASPGPLDRQTRFPYTSDTNYLLINFCQGPPSHRAFIEINEPQLFDGPHWLTFPAYAFEGFTPAAREEITRNGYRVRAYRIMDR
jgi:hypothetical protein